MNKNSFFSIRNLAILGLVSTIVFLIMGLIPFISVISIMSGFLSYLISIVSFLPLLFLVIYFIIVCIKLYTKKDFMNLKAVQIAVIISFVCNILVEFYNIIESLILIGYNIEIISMVLFVFAQIVSCIYYLNIFVYKKTQINNKIYACVNIGYFIAVVILCLINKEHLSIESIISSFIWLLHIPYFYKYYELLQGKKEN